MDWDWDEAKATANLKKHKVSFDLATMIFDDPNHLSRYDLHPDGDRWQTVGRPSGASPLVLLVIHTEFDEDGCCGRIISARKATSHERRAYEEGTF